MLSEDILEEYFSKKFFTQTGFVLLKSLKAQPIALLIKNSSLQKLFVRIFSKTSVFVFSFLKSWWSMAILLSQIFSLMLHSSKISSISSNSKAIWPIIKSILSIVSHQDLLTISFFRFVISFGRSVFCKIFI